MIEKQYTYDFLVNKFGEEKISERYKYLYAKMEDYIKLRNVEDKVTINRGILHNVVIDYFADVHRLKEFHNIKSINIIKIASYTAYWLWRRKPLQIVNDDDTSLSFINEAFVTSFLVHEYTMPIGTVPLDKNSNEKYKAFIDQLYYHLKYRYIDKQTIELMFCSFEAGKGFGND